MVYVLNKFKKPLMPCSQSKARSLLKRGKAHVVRKCPFTIRLLWNCENQVQEVKASIVPSSSKIGVAAASKNKCLYCAEVEVRQDISKKMKRRKAYRRNRRSNKTRYRACRFLNRKRKRVFTPTLRSKLESHLREIKRVSKILPITSWTIIRNSIKKDYKGYKDLEWLNLQRQTFERDNFKCRHCKGKSKDFELHAHHLIFKIDGGKDELENLATLCKTCHTDYHKGEFELKIGEHNYKGKLDTELVIIRKYLKLPKDTKNFKTYGFKVKARRKELGLEATSLNNACAILKVKPEDSYYIKNVPKGDYQRTKGIRSEQVLPKGKIIGFSKFDKVCFEKHTYFIKGRMNSGYFIGMDILGNALKGKTLKACSLHLITRRSSYLIV